jgi:hypothetical protein
VRMELDDADLSCMLAIVNTTILGTDPFTFIYDPFNVYVYDNSCGGNNLHPV